MKFVIVFVAFVGFAAAGILPETIVPVLEHTETRDEVGQYSVRYLTGNGIAAAQRGSFVPNEARNDNELVVEGSYAYNAPDGRTYTVKYRGDKNGFRAEGDHLPVAPEVPLAV